jgi:hypothetical protein
MRKDGFLFVTAKGETTLLARTQIFSNLQLRVCFGSREQRLAPSGNGRADGQLGFESFGCDCGRALKRQESWSHVTPSATAALSFRNSFPAFSNRGLPGVADTVKAIPELVARGAASVKRFYHQLEPRLEESRFIAGPRFTIADITALCVVDFAVFAKLPMPEGNIHTKRRASQAQDECVDHDRSLRYVPMVVLRCKSAGLHDRSY